jgi:hypothetical protein
MVSETSICNQALTWLGSEPITSLDEDSREANWMKQNYPFLRDAVLEERMWTFATDRATSTVADMDAWGSMYVHPRPTEWMAVYRVYNNVSNEIPNNWITSEGWRMEGGNVLAKDPTVYMWGLKRITDTGAFSSLFVQALAARLAADAAIPMTENRQLQADMWALYGDKIREATARDGQQGASDKVTQRRLTGVRWSGGYT